MKRETHDNASQSIVYYTQIVWIHSNKNNSLHLFLFDDMHRYTHAMQHDK